MVMVVEIVSKEFIKPTSPTPPHLRTHRFSFLDQFLPSIYVPMVLFYMDQERSIPVAASNSRRSQLLKESLSETLTLFYPLGAYNVEARVNRHSRELLHHLGCGGIAIGASFFPTCAALTRKSTLLALFSKGKWKSRRIILMPQQIGHKTVSSIEVVSSPTQQCIKQKSDIQKSTLIRARHQIPNHSMGNFLCLAAALVTAKETELDNLVCHLRKEIRKIDGDGGLLKYCEYMKEIGKGTNDNIDIILFSSWCNFGLYEIDFGWGKPTWVTCATESKSEIGMVNTIVLMDTKMGNGVEARVFLEEQHMVMLEQNQELLAFGILDQSPLNLKVG
ncbi:hypothetical protein GOBAR_DD11192 [Gossypium barbadense]|nr:hypothetical protein GOBAR_DD11192 [Gossypium barbadense]